jgi:ERCC4-related helicase
MRVFEKIGSYDLNPKFEYILDLLNKKQKKDCFLIFFQNYETAKRFKSYVLDRDPFKNIQVIGGKSKMSPKQRDLCISRINKSDVDGVLCTSVMEEGVNIKNVQKVILYTPTLDPIKLIQRKGRTGRYADGQIVILYYDNTFEKYLIEKRSSQS